MHLRAVLYVLPYTQLMLRDYIRVALEHAHYEFIEDDEPFYGEVPELKGVWATGETLEACRSNLESTIVRLAARALVA